MRPLEIPEIERKGDQGDGRATKGPTEEPGSCACALGGRGHLPTVSSVTTGTDSLKPEAWPFRVVRGRLPLHFRQERSDEKGVGRHITLAGAPFLTYSFFSHMQSACCVLGTRGAAYTVGGSTEHALCSQGPYTHGRNQL